MTFGFLSTLEATSASNFILSEIYRKCEQLEPDLKENVSHRNVKKNEKNTVFFQTNNTSENNIIYLLDTGKIDY